jgi:hypothetical protein
LTWHVSLSNILLFRTLANRYNLLKGLSWNGVGKLLRNKKQKTGGNANWWFLRKPVTEEIIEVLDLLEINTHSTPSLLAYTNRVATAMEKPKEIQDFSWSEFQSVTEDVDAIKSFIAAQPEESPANLQRLQVSPERSGNSVDNGAMVCAGRNSEEIGEDGSKDEDGANPLLPNYDSDDDFDKASRSGPRSPHDSDNDLDEASRSGSRSPLLTPPRPPVARNFG